MRVAVLAVGRLKAGPERELAERYRERAAVLARGLGFGSVEVVEIAESRARRPAERRAEEAAALLAGRGGGRLIALDERGTSLSSEGFAARCAEWRDSGEDSIQFVIGGADGLGDAVRARADLVLSFGPATFPHQLVRILVLEQIYRAMTILAGHPYHRA